MAAPIVRDLVQARANFARWSAQRLPHADAVEILQLRAPQGGASSDTLFAEAEIRDAGRVRKQDWVLRIQASAIQIYQHPDVERQFRIMQALGNTNEVPVPRVLWFEPDPALFGAPFFVMERVPGQVVSQEYNGPGWLAELSSGAREALWLDAVRTLARLHMIEPSRLQFLQRPQLGATGLDQEIALWDAYYDWSRIPKHAPLERAQRWLHDHAPEHRPTGLAWGDAQLANMIFRDGACVAVIDWETVSLGGPEGDLAWWLVFDDAYSAMAGRARLPGLGDRAATIAAWEEFTGRRVAAMEWHEVFARWRAAMITERAIALYAASGRPIPGLAPGAGNPYVERLARLLSEH